MKKIVFNNIEECIYKETLNNGVEVYFYPTDKTKNFYMTISVKYGAGIKEYSANDSLRKNIIPGTAHFLEHKIMNFTNRKSMAKIMNELGLYANAYTSYEVTNYNIFGSKQPVKSLKLLLDLFYNLNVTDKNVEDEKGIIIEEYKMYNDTSGFRINRQMIKNAFKNSYLNDVLVGETQDIKKITKKDLIEIYNTFYTTDNTFIIITGNFNKNEIVKFLNEYMKKVKSSKNKKVKSYCKKEPKNVSIPYCEISENITTPKVIFCLKIRRSDLAVKNIVLKRYYLNFIFSSLFSVTSDVYEKYRKNGLILFASSNIISSEEDYLINLNITTDKPDILIEQIKEDFKNIVLPESIFERKKKMFLNNLILGFENIEDVEFLISNNIIKTGRVINDSYEILKNMNYKEFSKVVNSINFNNYSILKVLPKK